MHIRVLTSCTGAKASTREPLPAEELYCGQHHVRLMRGVAQARGEGLGVDLAIVSARHGVVEGWEPLLPYEQTFQGKPASTRRFLARKLEVPTAARRALDQPADLHVVLLGDDYLEACELGDDVRPSAPALVLCAAGTALRMRPIPHVHVIALATDDTRRFHCGLVALKGEVGGRLLAHIANVRPSVEELTAPALLETLTRVRTAHHLAASPLF